MNRKLGNSRSEARLRDSRRKTDDRSSVSSKMQSHRSTALPPFAMLKQGNKLSQSQPQTERAGLGSTLVSARTTLSRPPLPSKRVSQASAQHERLSLQIAKQLSSIRSKYCLVEHRQRQSAIDYIPIVNTHRNEISSYDQSLNRCQTIQQELNECRTRIRELEETKHMMNEDRSSAQYQRVLVLMAREQCEQLLEIYSKQYPEQAELLTEQQQLEEEEDTLQRQLQLLREGIQRNEKKWSQSEKNLNVRTRFLHLSEVIKSLRLELLNKEDQCNVMAATLKVKTLRHLICRFVLKYQQTHKIDKENGTEVWLCANGLIGQLIEDIEAYKKSISNAQLQGHLDSYTVLLRKLEAQSSGKQQCTALRTHHLSISQHYQAQIEKMHEQQRRLSTKREQLKTRLDLLLAREKELHLRDLNMEFMDSKAINSVLRKVNFQQNSRIQRIKEAKAKLNVAEQHLNKQPTGEPKQNEDQVGKQLSQEIRSLQSRIKQCEAELEQQQKHKKAMEKKLSGAMQRIRENSQNSLQTKIQTLCYQLGRIEKQFTCQPELPHHPTVKETLSIVPSMVSNRRQDDQPSKTSKQGFQSNRDLLKSTCLSYFNRNDHAEMTAHLPLPGTKIRSIRSSMVVADDLRPTRSIGTAQSLLPTARTTR